MESAAYKIEILIGLALAIYGISGLVLNSSEVGIFSLPLHIIIAGTGLIFDVLRAKQHHDLTEGAG